MSLVVRKPVFGVSDQVWHNPGCTVTEDGYKFEILYLGSRGIVLSMKQKQRCCSASRLPRSWSVSLFSHMHKSGFLTTRLILCFCFLLLHTDCGYWLEPPHCMSLLKKNHYNIVISVVKISVYILHRGAQVETPASFGIWFVSLMFDWILFIWC